MEWLKSSSCVIPSRVFHWCSAHHRRRQSRRPSVWASLWSSLARRAARRAAASASARWRWDRAGFQHEAVLPSFYACPFDSPSLLDTKCMCRPHYTWHSLVRTRPSVRLRFATDCTLHTDAWRPPETTQLHVNKVLTRRIQNITGKRKKTQTSLRLFNSCNNHKNWTCYKTYKLFIGIKTVQCKGKL